MVTADSGITLDFTEYVDSSADTGASALSALGQ